jgi:alpha-glucosidase
MLELYRAALHARREHPALGDGGLTWLELPDGALGFTREPGFACLVNVAADPLALPEGYRVLLATGELADGRLPADTAAWLTAAR